MPPICGRTRITTPINLTSCPPSLGRLHTTIWNVNGVWTSSSSFIIFTILLWSSSSAAHSPAIWLRTKGKTRTHFKSTDFWWTDDGGRRRQQQRWVVFQCHPDVWEILRLEPLLSWLCWDRIDVVKNLQNYTPGDAGLGWILFWKLLPAAAWRFWQRGGMFRSGQEGIYVVFTVFLQLALTVPAGSYIST